jgi:hypothetical protein
MMGTSSAVAVAASTTIGLLATAVLGLGLLVA